MADPRIAAMSKKLEELSAKISDEKERKRFLKEMEDFKKIFTEFLMQKPGVQWEKIKPPPANLLLNHDSLPSVPESERKGLLSKLAVIKLNGGLGTTMGCTGPKSVIEVADGQTFLDVVIAQISSLNKKYSAELPLVLMNSFNTHDDTLKLLDKYSHNKNINIKCFNQSRHPRFLKDRLLPIAESGEYTSNKEHWYPPGHGDVYDSLYNSGLLDELMKEGKEWVFISNIDNLGSTVDFEILQHCVKGDAEFIMEVTDKTRADIKGGTLIDYEGKAMLLELAQVPPSKVDEFKSVTKFKIFNTNNLWIKLSAIKRLVEENAFKDMDVIINHKVAFGKQVIQLERAAGAAIHFFKGSQGVNVPRTRFLPVKTCSDLFVVQSNIYVRNDGIMQFSPKRAYPAAPLVNLGPYFRKVADYSARLPSIPDLLELDSLTVSGDVSFGRGVSLRGTVVIVVNEGQRIEIPAGSIIENKVVTGHLRFQEL